ncbi:transcriptional regulator [Nonomuraea sp. NN258]|uniref:transcriptional regulator n=1 Tax=Nonomuraea antri TaxID=2730852 RepID=UPI001569C15F|nr:transcriptional regulator [Nonomuraea antri]NRQ39382.1 transcriptional regulator [Nonomuraea antri]
MDTAVTRHPLTVLLERKHWTYGMFLRKVAVQHRARGFGGLATRKEKVARWISGVAVPQVTAQLAMADVFGVDEQEVAARGWPDWLLAAFDDDHAFWESPWTPAGSVTVLREVGGPVDRRGFLIASTGTLAAMVAQWATAETASATLSVGSGLTTSVAGRRIGVEVAGQFDARLAALRHLDDEIGSAHVYDAATTEIRIIARLLAETTHSEQVGRRLHSAAAEACRLAGWCAYDSGHHASAERHFIAALRAAASAGDHSMGALTLAFWANLRYTGGDPRGALDLLDGALSARRNTSARVVALLHARQARAHSLVGEPVPALRAVEAAFSAYGNAAPAEEDLPALYWLNTGELHQFAGSAALSLGEPGRALEHFDAALRGEDPYDREQEARGAAIYLARRSEAHLALGELDAAVEVAEQVVELMGGVESARGTSALEDLRGGLLGHQDVPVVRTFLELTA